MKICYCITAYNEPKLLQRIVGKLRHDNSMFFIHVDKRTDDTLFREYLRSFEDSVYFVPEDRRIVSVWGDISTSKAILELMNMAIEVLNNEKAYFIIMSGCDYPIKSAGYIYNYFLQKYPTDFISYLSLDNCSKELKKLILSHVKHYWLAVGNKMKLEIAPYRYIRPRCIVKKDLSFRTLFLICKSVPRALFLWFKPRKYPSCINLVTSETWMELSDKTVVKLLSFLDKHPEVEHYHKYVGLPEETFLQSIITVGKKAEDFHDFLIYLDRNRAGKKGSMELTIEDKVSVLNALNAPDFLFMRKTSMKNKDLLDYVDTIIV